MKKYLITSLFLLVSCGKELALEQGTLVHAAGSTHSCHVSVSGIGTMACYNFILKKNISDSLQSFCTNEIRQQEQNSLESAKLNYTVSTSYTEGSCNSAGLNTSGYCLASFAELDTKVYFYTSDNNAASSACNSISQSNPNYRWVSNYSSGYASRSSRSSDTEGKPNFKEVSFSGFVQNLIK